MTDDLNQQIEREVQRRLAQQVRQKNDEIADLESVVKQCRDDLIRQNELITRLTTDPAIYGTLVQTNSTPDVRKFAAEDEVIVYDASSHYHLTGGRIVKREEQPLIDGDGRCRVLLINGVESSFSIGTVTPAQIRLTRKADGTSALVELDGRIWEVAGVPDPTLQPGDPVKIRPDNKAIIGRGQDLQAGMICDVVALHGNLVEVTAKGENRTVLNHRGLELKSGDRVVVDNSLHSILRKLPSESGNRYRLTSDLSTDWDSIGGLVEAKREVRDAVELQLLQKELYEFYGIKPLRGILFYGPPGCGKTLLARALATAMAKAHGAASQETGYIYVKAPEILDKWVGNTEKEIRLLFDQARRHFRQYGYKAVLAIDEAEAIMPQRGSRRSSDIADTIVPMFLGEMDGIDAVQTAENPLVILMTNRPDVLDPAITRPGRISRHIKINRPSEMESMDILDIHTRTIPFAEPDKKKVTLTIGCADLFSKSHLLYRINNEHDFTLGDCVSGAMLENIAESAKMVALRRDLAEGTRTGVRMDDFRQAVKATYEQQQGLNHAYDIGDFCDRHGLQQGSAKVERCFGSSK